MKQLILLLLSTQTNAFLTPPKLKKTTFLRAEEIKTLVPWRPKSDPNIGLNNFFKDPVPDFVKDSVEIVKVSKDEQEKFGVVSQIISPPQYPGIPRPLWVVIAASIPTGKFVSFYNVSFDGINLF